MSTLAAELPPRPELSLVELADQTEILRLQAVGAHGLDTKTTLSPDLLLTISPEGDVTLYGGLKQASLQYAAVSIKQIDGFLHLVREEQVVHPDLIAGFDRRTIDYPLVEGRKITQLNSAQRWTTAGFSVLENPAPIVSEDDPSIADLLRVNALLGQLRGVLGKSPQRVGELVLTGKPRRNLLRRLLQ